MTDSTTWQIYTSNPEAWNAMIEACGTAKRSIDLENFIFEQDEVGNKFIEICARKAAEGVRVRFIWDAAGSFSFFGSSIVEDLRKKGIELIFFKTLLPDILRMHNYRSWYFRNHRRSLIIDTEIGFTGSVSISKRAERWRDTNVRIYGPVVLDMQKEFEKIWSQAQGKKVARQIKNRIGYEFRYITNTPLPRNRHLYREIVEAIRNTRKHIYITTPYFVPTHRMARVLRLAAHRGVDVRLLIPEKSDFPIVDLGARTFFHGLLRSGVKIYLYKNEMLHSKTMLIDDDWASVGTLNLDHISLLYNFEANLVTDNIQFTSELVSHFNHDLENSHKVTVEEWQNRFFGEKIATFFVKFVRIFL